MIGRDPWAVVISAEHGGNRVPPEHAALFQGHDALLRSHRGWDPGTADLARRIGEALGVSAVVSDVTRLLVDLNRSPHHPRVFSEITRPLPAAARRLLLARHHEPHRGRVRAEVERALDAGEVVLHLGIHSFTPVLDGRVRRADLALLYDPGRPEAALAETWARGLRAALPGMRVRRNYPYEGRSDGLTTTLRRIFPGDRYMGIEIEVNQGLIEENGCFPGAVVDALVGTLPGREVVSAFRSGEDA